MLVTLLAMYTSAQAADRYWDVNGTGLTRGGAGTWNLTNPFWSPNGDGVSGPYSAWNNGALDNAFFGGTGGAVTLGVPITAHNLSFETAGYMLNGNTLTLSGVAPTITTNAGVTATINTTIAGTSGLTMVGTGTLSLTGTNTFSGDINLNAGRLLIDDNAALGDASNGVTAANGTWLTATGALASTRTISVISGVLRISGAGAGSAFFTGAGGLTVDRGTSLTNDANNYTGGTTFSCQDGNSSFSSIGNLGQASALGAPTTAANGRVGLCSFGQAGNSVTYIGDGDSSNRDWTLTPFGNVSAGTLQNAGTGTLTLTGNILANVQGSAGSRFLASTGDMQLLGVISSGGGGNGAIFFESFTGRSITLGDVNTFVRTPVIRGGGTTIIGTLANSGIASSLGAGSTTILIDTGGTLRYVGDGDTSNRLWSLSNGTLNNNGTGALVLSGTMTTAGTATLGGSFSGVPNTFAGVISGTGSLASGGAGTWGISGINTYTGSTIVNGGTLRADSAGAFGASTTAVVNGGTLALNGFDRTFTSLSGTGGAVALGGATLTLNGPAATNASYAGSITGNGGLTKLGGSTQTLSGASTYTGATTVNGGTLRLNFGAAGAPVSNIIGSGSTLNLGGGVLNMVGANGVANTQTFNGLNVTGSNSTVSATSGTGGSTTVNFGAITHSGGLINFGLPTNGNFTTTNTVLGGWATVNGTDYAKVVGGNITAFTDADYSDKDNAANWLANEYISDVAGFFGTVGGTVQLAGLRYTAPVSTTVTVAAGQTLGVDGTIIVAPSVGGFNQIITGGMITGTSGGGALGIQQNSTGNFTIASQIVDNGGSVGFVKAGTGLVTLTNANNIYTGATTVAQGTLSVNSIGNGGVASSIGASTAASSNLSLEGATLRYTGASTSSDRGFIFAKSGAIQGDIVEVTNAAANLSFSGLVTSMDSANFTKTGAGTLTLANAGNDYTGITTVNGGMLSVNTLADGGLVSGMGAAGSASANLVLAGGGLQYTGATVSSNRGFTLGAGNGSIDVSNAASTLTLSGTAVGTGSLTKAGGGTLVLSGTNTYTGGNTVSGGILRAGSIQAFGTGPVSLANTTGVALDLNNFNNTIGALSGGGANGGNVTLGAATLRIQGGTGAYAGNISGTGGITQASGTTTMVGCNNSYTGVTNIGGAITTDCLRNGGINSGIGASGSASTNLVFSGGTLTYTGGTVTTDRGFNLAAAGTIGVTSAAATLTFDGQVIGAGGLVKTGGGTLVLTAANTYTGSTTISAGTLRVASTTALGGVGGLGFANAAGALLDLDGFNTTAAFLSGGGGTGGNITLDGATLTISNGGATYAGAISGIGSLIKNGAGTQTLSGCNNTYSGGTTINGGMLTVNCLTNGGTNSSIGTSSAASNNLFINGTLRYVGTGNISDRQFTMGTAGTTLDASGTGALQLTSTAAMPLAGTNIARTLTLTGTNTGSNTLSAQIDNNGTGMTALTKTGAGTWVLTNNNSTYTGITTINGGVLSVAQMADGGLASSMGASTNAAANLVIGNGSTLRYTGAGDSTNRLFTLNTGVTFIESSGTGAINFSNTGAVTLSGTNTARTMALGGTNTGANTMGGAIGDNGTGATTLAKNDSGTWVLTGNNTYTGNTVINNGNLVIGNGGTTGNAGAGAVIVDSATSTLSINRSDTFAFNGTLSGPGTLAQIGTGTTTLTSASNSIGATTISAGTLDINGGLTTPTIAMSGTSMLNVDGIVQAAGGAATVLSGDAGNSTVNVNAGATLRANGNLGGGSDAINVTGTLDTGAAVLGLGAGDDTLTLNDGAMINGAGIDAGLGVGDNLVFNNAAALAFSGTNVSGFERLIKQNTGVLTTSGSLIFSAGTVINGGTLDVDGSLETPTITMVDDTTLQVDGAVHAVGPAPTLISGSSGANTVLVDGGAILNANGDLGDGSDLLTLAGTLSTGGGILNLGAGDDTLTLNDGASITGNGIDAGAASSNDVLVLNNALDFTFDGSAVNGFELLHKQNIGAASLTGNQTFSASTLITGGMLDVNGNLTTPNVIMFDDTALTVDGTLQGGGGTPSTITGSTGINTVTISGTALASGDLGDGDDVLDVSGTLDTNGGIFALGAGDDRFIVHDTTAMTGAVDAGAGTDLLEINIGLGNTVPLGSLLGFESLGKSGDGTLQINGPSSFIDVEVLAGTLDVNSGVSAQNTTISNGAVLNLDGNYTGTAGVDTFTVAGTITGSGAIDLLDGDDIFTIQDGADLSGLATIVNGGIGTDTFVADLAGSAILGGATSFETLTKTNVGTLHVDGPAPSDFTAVNVDGGTLDIGGAGSISGVVNTTVASGATLNVDGNYRGSAGNDTMEVSGAIGGTGAIAFDDGDDVLTLNDGADFSGLTGILDGGLGNADTVVLNNAGALDFGAGSVIGFETLSKQNTGTATLLGSHSYSGGTNLAGGALVVSDTLTTPSVTLSDDTVLTVNGALQAGGGTAAVINGSVGTNTVTVNGTALASGNLGEGADTLDVIGTLDAGSGFLLGDGDDNFVVHDGSTVLGTVDGGAGLDTRVYDINLSAQLGTLVNFEGVTKTGTGTLNIMGPGATDLAEVSVLGGILNIGPGGSVVAIAGSALDTVIAAGATLNVDGSFGCGTGADTMTVAGIVSGSGTIEMCGGDDVLTLQDGAVLANIVSGGADIDTVVLDNASAMMFDGDNTINFEVLQKNNVSEATLTGTSSFTGGTVLNDGILTVAGSLTTPTVAMADGTALNVDGALQGAGGTAAAITGSAGVNTMSVTGTVLANGDLGAGNDVLDVAGTLDTAGGTFALGDGDDTLTIHDGTNILGTVVAGAGNDTFNADIAASADLGAVQDFETLSKTNVGVLNINGPMGSDFTTVNVLGGTLNVTAGGSVSAQTTTVAADATLDVQGSYTGTAGDDVLDIAGTLNTGAGSLLLGDGNDTFTIHDGTVVLGTVAGGAGMDTFNTDIATVADLGAVNGFEALNKTGVGMLNVNGPAVSDFSLVTVNGGTLNVTAGGSIVAASGGALNTVVAAGATLNVDGSFGCGVSNDSLTVAGTVSGSGTIDMCGGEDVLALQDGAVLDNVVSGGSHGAGDTVVLDIAGALTFDAANTINFEYLQKDNTGAATLTGTQSFSGGTALNGGTLTVAGQLDTPTVALSDDTVLNIGGTLQASGGTAAVLAGSAGANTVTVAGTLLANGDLSDGADALDVVGTLNTLGGTLAMGAGDDRLTSRGTVLGTLAFGDGNDTADFFAGDLSGLTSLDGGAGSDDRVAFHGMTLDSKDVSPLTAWERVDLVNGTELTLGTSFNLGTGLLSIDGTSELIANVGASLTGNLANAGLITVGSNRFGISGNYAGGGALALTVSPSGMTSGGLNISGDVTGTTAVTFVSDGTETLQPSASILVISSPNDDLATAGGFTAAGSVNGVVRLNGSVVPWAFEQQANDWYLNAQADSLLPEVIGYAVLPSIGQFGIQENNRLLFERMAGVRGDTPRCGAAEEKEQRAYWKLTGDCHGFWMAATASELEMGDNPGYAFSGDNLGVYVGADVLLQDRETRSFRGGLFAGFQRGNYWTAAANLGGLEVAQANVRLDTPILGMYASAAWSNGTYIDMTLAGQRPEATIAIADGFSENLLGNSLTASAQVGHRVHLSNGWTVEPQVNLSASAVHWQDKVDASGKQLVMEDDLLGMARVAVRAEKVFTTGKGARIRPWATVGVQDTVGEKENALTIMSPVADGGAEAFPNHELGLTAAIDVGVEAEMNESVSLFGVISYGESLSGTDSKQRQANLGVRIYW